jgi:hypothetical protein
VLRLTELDVELRALDAIEATLSRRLVEAQLRKRALEWLLERERGQPAEPGDASTSATRTGLVSEAECQLQAASRDLEQLQTRLTNAGDGRHADRSTLERRRRALLAELPEDIARIHAALLRAGRSPTIVAVKDGYCAGCHLRVTAQLANRVENIRELARCEHCRRLLYGAKRFGGTDA